MFWKLTTPDAQQNCLYIFHGGQSLGPYHGMIFEHQLKLSGYRTFDPLPHLFYESFIKPVKELQKITGVKQHQLESGRHNISCIQLCIFKYPVLTITFDAVEVVPFWQFWHC